MGAQASKKQITSNLESARKEDLIKEKTASLQRQIDSLQLKLDVLKKLKAKKPSEKAAFFRSEALDDINKELEQVEAALLGLKDQKTHSYSIKEEAVLQHGNTGQQETIKVQPSLVDMSPEDFITMMLKAEPSHIKTTYAILLMKKLQLLELKQSLEEPLPDLSEEDRSFELAQNELNASTEKRQGFLEESDDESDIDFMEILRPM